MGPPSYMRSAVDRNVVMRLLTVLRWQVCDRNFAIRIMIHFNVVFYRDTEQSPEGRKDEFQRWKKIWWKRKEIQVRKRWNKKTQNKWYPLTFNGFSHRFPCNVGAPETTLYVGVACSLKIILLACDFGGSYSHISHQCVINLDLTIEQESVLNVLQGMIRHFRIMYSYWNNMQKLLAWQDY